MRTLYTYYIALIELSESLAKGSIHRAIVIVSCHYFRMELDVNVTFGPIARL